jgi:hypothetical protein
MPFSVLVTLDFPCTAHAFFSEFLSNHCHGRSTFSETCTKSDAVPLSDPSWNHNRPHKRLQIKACKNQHVHPVVWDIVHWLPISTECITVIWIVFIWLTQKWSLSWARWIQSIS